MNTVEINKKLIIRFLENRCSPKEADLFMEFIRASNSQEELKEILQGIWAEEKEEGYDVDFNSILSSIHHSIISKEVKGSASDFRKSRIPVSRKIYLILSRAPAILFIPLLIYTLVFNASTNQRQQPPETVFAEMHSPSGVRTSIDLPDGTRVWLNSDSWIKYPVAFDDRVRQVEFSGEAFFQVSRNEAVPFVVSTDEIDVKVLGTSFNIENYRDQDNITTTLVEGKVEMQKKTAEGQSKILTNLEPNELLRYDKATQKAILHKDVNTYKHISWIEGKTVFDNDPLNYVFDKLSRHYNVDIDYDAAELSRYTFTASFGQEDFEQVLSLIKLAIPLEYSIQGSVKLGDNTFSKKKYRINLKGR